MTGFLLYFVLTTSSPNPPLKVPKYTAVENATCGLVPDAYTKNKRLVDQSINPSRVYIFDEGKPGTFCSIDVTIDVNNLPVGTYTVITFTLVGSTNPPNVKVGRETVETFLKQ